MGLNQRTWACLLLYEATKRQRESTPKCWFSSTVVLCLLCVLFFAEFIGKLHSVMLRWCHCSWRSYRYPAHTPPQRKHGPDQRLLFRNRWWRTGLKWVLCSSRLRVLSPESECLQCAALICERSRCNWFLMWDSCKSATSPNFLCFGRCSQVQREH